MNISDVLAEAAIRWPHDTALVDLDAPGGRREFTFEELGLRVRRTAGGLRALGLAPGDRVALLMYNSWEYTESFLGIAAAGLVSVPLNTRLLQDEHAGMVRDSGARLLIADDSLLQERAALAAIPELGVAVVRPMRPLEAVRRSFESLASDPPLRAVAGASHDLVSIMYTSGTTGLPKGVMLTHGSWLATGEYVQRYLNYAHDEVTLHTAALTHGSGWLLLPTLAIGGKTVLCARFHAARTLGLFHSEAVTSGFFVPTMIQMLLDASDAGYVKPRSLRAVYYAGSPIDPATLRHAMDLLGNVLIQSFGQVESPMFLTVLDRTDHERIASGQAPHLIRSAGRPVHGAQVKLVDDNDRDLPVGEVGEIVAKSPQVMKGYWNRPEATAATMKGDWLHTGDVGRFDADGYLYVVDRKKDMIVSGGSNVYAREVEQALLAMEEIKDAAVIGLPHPKWGEMVTAVLVSHSGTPVHDEVMAEFCRTRIADYRRPKRFIWVEALPRNLYGKVLKRDLRAHFSEEK